MEDKAGLLEPLIEGAKEYSKTSYELIKLKALDKTADIGSAVLSRLLLFSVVSLFIVSLNIGVALWVGELCGKLYYGFFIVGAFYLLLGIILYFIHPSLKKNFSNSIIAHTLN